MRAEDIMTRHVITVSENEGLDHAIRLMLQYGIGGLPVVNANGSVVGILSEADLLRRSELHTERRRPRLLECLVSHDKKAQEYIHTHSLWVRDVMTRNAVTVTPETDLGEIVDLMEEHDINRLPVVNDKGWLVGIVSRSSLVRALMMVARELPPTDPSDAMIRERLEMEIRKFSWAPHIGPNVIVHNGVVRLYGAVANMNEAEAIRVAAENVPGVKLVRNNLKWWDPSSGILFDFPKHPSVPPTISRH